MTKSVWHSRSDVRVLKHSTGSGRQTRNSRAAGVVKAKSYIGTAAKFRAQRYRGTYVFERHHGNIRINKGRRHKIKTEADHAPTDGSQRGGLARNSAQNRIDTLQRTAFSVPKVWHRKHPTTGNRNDNNLAHGQKVMSFGYPHVGDAASAIRRGRYMAFKKHLDAYGPIVSSGPKYGSNIFKGVRHGVSNAIEHQANQYGFSSMQVSSLKKASKKVFGGP